MFPEHPLPVQSPGSSLETNSDQLSPSVIKSEPCMIKFESDACLERSHKHTASKGRKGALASSLGVGGGQCLDLFSKEVLCTDPGAVGAGLEGQREIKGLLETL